MMVGLVAGIPSAQAADVTNLRCEYLVNPFHDPENCQVNTHLEEIKRWKKKYRNDKNIRYMDNASPRRIMSDL